MTNAEKYKEVFGMPADSDLCPTVDCTMCPVASRDSNGCMSCTGSQCVDWWSQEYKGNDTVKVEVTEVHTFAKPDEVNNLDFPNSSSENK